jgi:hypothetical protein
MPELCNSIGTLETTDQALFILIWRPASEPAAGFGRLLGGRPSSRVGACGVRLMFRCLIANQIVLIVTEISVDESDFRSAGARTAPSYNAGVPMPVV